MAILVLFLVLALVAVLAPRYGVDSRGRPDDWPAGPGRGRPRAVGRSWRSRTMGRGSTEDRRSAPVE